MATTTYPDEDGPQDISGAVRSAIIALESDGRLTAEQVVDAAREPTSPLHDCFEWDDDKAAHAHRVAQARTLIRSVKLVVEVQERVLATPRYVRDPAAGREQGYVAQDKLRTEPEHARALILYEFGRAVACLQRAHNIAQTQGIAVDVMSMVSGLQSAQQMLKSA